MISPKDCPIKWNGFASKNIEIQIPDRIISRLPIDEELNKQAVLYAFKKVMNYDFLHEAMNYELEMNPDEQDSFFKKKYSEKLRADYLNSPFIHHNPQLETETETEYKDNLEYQLESLKEDCLFCETDPEIFFEHNSYFHQLSRITHSKINLFSFHLEAESRNVLSPIFFEGKYVYTVSERPSDDFLGLIQGKYIIINYLNKIEESIK